MKEILATFCFIMASLFNPLQGAWGPSGCAVAQTGWQTHDGVQYYYSEGRLLGSYRDGEWYPFNGRSFGFPATPPWVTKTAKCKCGVCKCGDCKCGQKFSTEPLKTYADNIFFGVDHSKLHKGEARYSLSGKPCLKHEALAALQLTDDSAKPFVTFIGKNSSEKRDVFLTTPEAAKCRVHAYADGHWATQCGFVSGGPMVYVQNAKGEVLYRKDNPKVEELVGEIRKAQPDYNPALDPNGTKPGFDFAQFAPLVAFIKEHAGWVAVVSVLLLLFFKRN